METKNIYQTPEITSLDIQTEGLLCESGEGNINPLQTGGWDWE